MEIKVTYSESEAQETRCTNILKVLSDYINADSLEINCKYENERLIITKDQKRVVLAGVSCRVDGGYFRIYEKNIDKQ
jgi:hypothetical protein